MNGKIKVTLVHSKNHRSTKTLAMLQTLGLKKMNSSRLLPDNPSVRGVCAKLSHMVKVEEAAQ
jgi:large subunit ribosomal protein L30